MSPVTESENALVDRIYEASTDPDLWQVVVDGCSEVFGGAAVALGLPLPGDGRSIRAYRAHLDARYTPVFLKHLLEGTLPWGSLTQPSLRSGFGAASDLFPDAELAGTDFYREWMQPQGLAPEGPLAFTISEQEGLAGAGIAIYRRSGGRAFTPEDRALADRLAPHLRRGYGLSCRFADTLARQDALAAIIDRLPQGIILLDVQGRVLSVSRRAEQIARLGDGFRLGVEGPRADDPRDQAALRRAIERTLAGVTGFPHQNVLPISRPSGRPDFGVIVVRLLGEPHAPTDAAIAIFIGDPTTGHVPTESILQGLFKLTPAEAAVVRLLSEGRTLEQTAEIRGVTLNTVRTQLKQIFSKTGTSRQGDLLRLVLTSVAPMGDEEDG